MQCQEYFLTALLCSCSLSNLQSRVCIFCHETYYNLQTGKRAGNQRPSWDCSLFRAWFQTWSLGKVWLRERHQLLLWRSWWELCWMKWRSWCRKLFAWDFWKEPRYWQSLGQRQKAFYDGRLLLAPTGALVMMMVYYISAQRQLFQIFTQTIDAIDVTSVTLSRLNSINADDVTRYFGDILRIFWG